MTSHTDVVAAFSAALVDFPVNHDRPDNAYVQLVFDTIANILYSITNNTVKGVHNLMRIIQEAKAYATKYTVAFVHPTRPKAFGDTINTTEAVSLASRKAEAIHRAKLADWATYHAASRISRVVDLAKWMGLPFESKEIQVRPMTATQNSLLSVVAAW